ncbi:MAG: RNA polymerase sigma-70 factor [Balneolales bacterium]
MSKSDKEGDWILKIRGGDKEAFKMLYLKYYGQLCRFAWRFLRSPHLSEEVVQDTFLSVWESRATLDVNKQIKSFLYKIVRNKSLNHLKRQTIVDDYNLESIWANDPHDTQKHDFKEKNDFLLAVNKAIENLPKGARQIYILYQDDGLTYKEISEVLEISTKTVESQMTRALKLIRQEITEKVREI